MSFNTTHQHKLNQKIKKFKYLNMPFLVGTGLLVSSPLLQAIVAAEKFE